MLGATAARSGASPGGSTATLNYVLLTLGAALMAWSWWGLRRGYAAQLNALEQRRRELEAVAAELAAVAEDVMRDAQQRADQLRELCHQAELRIARLEAATGWSPMKQRVTSVPVVRPAAQAEGHAGRTAGAAGSGRAADPEGAVAATAADVRRLAEEGLGVTEIAKATGKTRGEVQLILGLKKLGRGAGAR